MCRPSQHPTLHNLHVSGWQYALRSSSLCPRAKGWKVWEANPGGGQIFRTLTDRLWGPASLLYNGYRISFPGIKRPGRGVDNPPSSSAKVKERVVPCLYSASVPSWPILRQNLPLQHYATSVIILRGPHQWRLVQKSCRVAAHPEILIKLNIWINVLVTRYVYSLTEDGWNHFKFKYSRLTQSAGQKTGVGCALPRSCVLDQHS